MLVFQVSIHSSLNIVSPAIRARNPILSAAAFCISKNEMEMECNQEKHDLCLCITVFDVLSTWRYTKMRNIFKKAI
jgi:hypothetical protein